MPARQNKKKRQQRYQRQLERQVQEHMDGPSEGQYCVFDKKTKEKHKGLNFKQAQALWNSLESAIILNDEHVRK